MHEALLGKLGVVDQIRIDQVLQVAPSVVGKEDIDRFGGLAAAAFRGDRIVDAVDDAGCVGEELVGVDFLHCLGDRLGAKGTSDLFQGKDLGCRGILYEVDVGEATLLRESRSLADIPSTG